MLSRKFNNCLLSLGGGGGYSLIHILIYTYTPLYIYIYLYIYSLILPGQGMVFVLSVLNRVYSLAQVCPKQGIQFPASLP